MTNPRKPAVIHIGVSAGEDEPGIDAQLAEGLRRAAEQGLEVGGVAGTIGGALNVARRGQVIRLFEQLRARELPAAVALLGIAPTDLADLRFLGQQARVYGLSVTVGPKHITVSTPWGGTTAGGPPA